LSFRDFLSSASDFLHLGEDPAQTDKEGDPVCQFDQIKAAIPQRAKFEGGITSTLVIHIKICEKTEGEIYNCVILCEFALGFNQRRVGSSDLVSQRKPVVHQETAESDGSNGEGPRVQGAFQDVDAERLIDSNEDGSDGVEGLLLRGVKVLAQWLHLGGVPEEGSNGRQQEDQLDRKKIDSVRKIKGHSADLEIVEESVEFIVIQELDHEVIVSSLSDGDSEGFFDGAGLDLGK